MLLLLHEEVPVVASLSVAEGEPLKHKFVVPVIGAIAGNAFTVIVFVEKPVHEPEE